MTLETSDAERQLPRFQSESRQQSNAARQISSRLWHLVTLMWRAEIRERRQERGVGIAVYAVAQRIVRRTVGKSQGAVQNRSVALRKRPQIDVDNVVFKTATVGIPRKIALQNAQPIAVSDQGGRRN